MMDGNINRLLSGLPAGAGLAVSLRGAPDVSRGMARFDGSERHGSILYGILRNEPRRSPIAAVRLRPPAVCSCVSEARAALRCPQVTSTAASAVLLKTLRFVKNVPCFRELPPGDQLLLVRGGWAQLLVLGMAQDGLDFDTTETPAERSLLQRILVGTPAGKALGWRRGERSGVPVTDIRAIKGFLSTCWGLDISTKEYAYLKGAVLFNPDLEGLQYQRHIEGLQREAHRALAEHMRMVRREEGARFAKLLAALCALRSVSASAVAELFFRPVIGAVDMEQLLVQMLQHGKEKRDG
ncbi:nuclear receptor subfamily 0 group B member 1-like [Scleropages formosus]|uniref:Nuclear receptor subfamily 0, group B, member 1 n=1 Tax=Scleropages formosus TaxID=113540 RepID=A0A8C9TWV3_SCLFO|nr:nuclear receptor subfamily 0 group B member 1-like [Scleropages formosus]